MRLRFIRLGFFNLTLSDGRLYVRTCVRLCRQHCGEHHAQTLSDTSLTPKAKFIPMVPRVLRCFEWCGASHISNRCFISLTKWCFARFGEHQAPTLRHMNLTPKAKLIHMVPRMLWCFEWCGALHISNRCFTYL